MAALSDAKRLVIKIGSALLVDRTTGALREDWLKSLAEDVAWLKSMGKDIIIVSSGSIALGRGVLSLGNKDLPLDQSQAAAAVGQIRLAGAYEDALKPHGITTAQVLVTLEDSANRRRYLNSRATLAQLLSLGVLPIVNENDTVATDEIRYGDNDRLAAQIALTTGADQLILLSDVDGFYSGNPQKDPSSKRFDTVTDITPEIEAMAGEGTSGLSKGGMITKLWAAKTATSGGCAMAITEGSTLNPLKALENGANATWFTAKGTPQLARKSWISSMKPQGRITVDQGAEAALQKGKSLLPAGISGVTGDFERGDPVEILAQDGRKLGQGLTAYTSLEAQAIKGKHSSDFEAILGYPARSVIIHRDDMAL